MLGALLDYAGVDRERFAKAWRAGPVTETLKEITEAVAKEGSPQQSFFGDK
jgi:hypothetical protein